MNLNSAQPMEKSPAQTAAGSPTRLFFIDNLRTGLILLVVLHHVALVYGASVEGYYYVEPPFTDPRAFLVLLVFALVNQSWFMGAFFLLAGYFTPGSYDRKGAGSFLKDRLLRLGIPLIIFYFVLNPISRLGWWLMPAELTGITTPPTWKSYPDMLGFGPLWFVALLLIFSFGYAAWRSLTKDRTSFSKSSSSALSYLGIGIFTLALAVVSYLLRIYIPIGKSVFEFPTLAYLPQYLSFFIVGVVASRHEWFRTLPGSKGVVGFLLALVAGVFLYPLAFSGQMYSLEFGPAFGNAMGNGHWQSAVYAAWDSITAVGLFLASITFFSRFFNGRGGFGSFLSQHSYAVFVFHIPIVVFTAYVLRGVALAPLFKFGLASVIVVPTCFIVAYLVRKLPLASRIF